MPSYTRRLLRQDLGKTYLRDTLVGTTTGSWGATASLTIIDSLQADQYLSGEQLYARAWVRAIAVATTYQDARVATFNTGSGAFQTLVTSRYTFSAGCTYEVHSILPPAEKDLVIDDTVKVLRQRREIPIAGVDGAWVYSIGPEILDVLDVRIFSYPVASKIDVGVGHWRLVTTASGQEIRLPSATTQSTQLVLDAVTTYTWSTGLTSDLDYVTIPDEAWLLSGAAARAYFLLEARAPSQEVQRFKERRREMAVVHSRLSSRLQPQVEREIQFNKGGF